MFIVKTFSKFAFAVPLILSALQNSAYASKTEVVTFPSGAETVSGFLAMPDSAGKHPAVIIIHEFWGLNDWVKGETKKFAEMGYVALAVDLYRGKVATTPDIAHELMRGLPDDRAMRDLEGAFAYLATRADVNPAKIGADGWCMGGGWSLKLAMHEPKLAACVLNYGALPTEPASIATIQAPVLGNFGAEDHGIPPESVQAFTKAMRIANKSVDTKVYDGAGHAFANPENKDGYRPKAAADAWKRTVDFLAKTLK